MFEGLELFDSYGAGCNLSHAMGNQGWAPMEPSDRQVLNERIQCLKKFMKNLCSVINVFLIKKIVVNHASLHRSPTLVAHGDLMTAP